MGAMCARLRGFFLESGNGGGNHPVEGWGGGGSCLRILKHHDFLKTLLKLKDCFFVSLPVKSIK